MHAKAKILEAEFWNVVAVDVERIENSVLFGGLLSESFCSRYFPTQNRRLKNQRRDNGGDNIDNNIASEGCDHD